MKLLTGAGLAGLVLAAAAAPVAAMSLTGSADHPHAAVATPSPGEDDATEGPDDATDQNAETVRRYMNGQPPSIEFLAAMCRRFELNPQWLVSGKGPMLRADARAHALRSAEPAELVISVIGALERLNSRVDRIESLVQAFESRSDSKPNSEADTAA